MGWGKGKKQKNQLERGNRVEGQVETGERGDRKGNRSGAAEPQNAGKAVAQLAVDAARETVPEKGREGEAPDGRAQGERDRDAGGGAARGQLITVAIGTPSWTATGV